MAASLTIAQAFADGLRIDQRVRARGQLDAEQGLPNRPPPGADLLSYAVGYANGKTLATRAGRKDS